MVLVVDSTSNENADLFVAAVDRALATTENDPSYVAFDCEGVKLSRAGTVEVVAFHFGNLADTDEVFLVDLGETTGIDSSLREKIKELLESKTVVKVIHDVRMDSDALFHLHGITVDNVHNTQAYHAVLTGHDDVNLNAMLSHNGIEGKVHDKSIYKTNPNFWASRPLTEEMKNWAAGDVDKLLAVAKKQVTELERRGAEFLEKARVLSSDYCKARDMQLARHVKCRKHVGKFIGKGGVNLRNLQKRTGTIVYNDDIDKEFMIFYNNPTSLTTVKHVMGY